MRTIPGVFRVIQKSGYGSVSNYKHLNAIKTGAKSAGDREQWTTPDLPGVVMKNRYVK